MFEEPNQGLGQDLPDTEQSTLPLAGEPSLPPALENEARPKAGSEEIGLFTSIGFALGFSALLFLNTYGIPAGLGMIFSALGLWQIKRKGEPGHAFAIWGVVLALLSLVWLGLQHLGLVITSGMLFNFIKGLLGFRT